MEALSILVLGAILMGLCWVYLQKHDPTGGKYSKFADTNWREGAHNFNMPRGSLHMNPPPTRGPGDALHHLEESSGNYQTPDAE